VESLETRLAPRRDQIVGDPKRAARRAGARDVEREENDGEQGLEEQRDAERGDRAPEFAADVLGGVERRRVQELGDTVLVVAWNREPGEHRGGEGVEKEAADREDLKIGWHLLAPSRSTFSQHIRSG
jgi:hypothetical protein